MSTDIFLIRIIGKNIEPGLIKSKELANILASVEDMIASIMEKEDHTIRKEDVIIGLKELSGGSIKLKFSSIIPAVAISAFMIAATAVNNRNYENLPRSSLNSLVNIASFTKKHNCSAELIRLEPENTVAVISSETEINIKPPIIGETTIYGKILRVGGKTPKVMIETLEGKVIYCDVDLNLAKKLGQKLYEFVSLSGVAKWDAHDLVLEDFHIKNIGGYEGQSISSTIKELSSAIGSYFKDIVDVKSYISEIRGGEFKDR